MLNVIDRIYENAHFKQIFAYSIVFLIIIFVVVFLIGLHDARKEKRRITKDKENGDISFDKTNIVDEIDSDVTFEIPSLTKNLENFKKSIEEAMQEEKMENYEVIKRGASKEVKNNKILDKDSIENTVIKDLPLVDEESNLE